MARAIRAALGLLTLSVLLGPMNAHAYTFGEPRVKSIGSEQTVFDYSRSNCDQWDIPDQAARAFRDDQGRVQLIDSHYNPRRKVGPDLHNVTHQCNVLLPAGFKSNPALHDALEWIWSPYTLDGRTVYALVHNEYRGWDYPGMCVNDGTWATLQKCWYNVITLAKSTDSGATYQQAAAPGHFVAGMPDRYDMRAGPVGAFAPSNIVHRAADGYYYAAIRTQEPYQPLMKTCMMRTKNLASPGSWRAWDGDSFTVRFNNIYAETPASRSQHLCGDLMRHYVVDLADNIVWSEHFQKYMLVGILTREPGTTVDKPGIYYSLSDDLVHWSSAKLIMQAPVPMLHRCGEPNPIRDPALLDPASSSRNFETVGRRPFLYFTRFNYAYGSGNCWMTADRDLIRIPIEFSGSPPTAALSINPSAGLAGQTAVFDASGSTDPNGSITKYEWDLDGDGYFETNTGASPRNSTSFANVRFGNVGLRVTDTEGLTDDLHRRFTVDAKINQQPDGAPLPASYAKDTGAPFSSSRGYGWVRQDSLSSATHTPLDMPRNTRDRDAGNTDAYDHRLDTFLYMQFPGTNANFETAPGAFEVAVPCANYQVTISVGDSAYSSSATTLHMQSTHRVNIEGETAIAGFRPSDSQKFQSATTTVSVCDGRLTIDAIGGSNTKLNYIDIQRVTARVNFQPSAVRVPNAHVKDIGSAYSSSRGFGWVREDSLGGPAHVPLSMTPNVKDRDLDDVDGYSQRLDTFIYMRYPGTNSNFVLTPGAFELALPCGTYEVTVSVGDSAYSSSTTALHMQSTHRVNVEGETAIAGFRPSDSSKFSQATKTISVCDGRLTIDSIGGVNTKLNYVVAFPVG